MKLIEKLNIRKINNYTTRFALFQCNYCNNIVEKRYQTGLNARSCGCNKTNFIIKHGDSDKTRLYNIWHGMKNRCNCPKKKDAKNYKDKGIKVCNSWKDNYIMFKIWALCHGYKDNLTIDRIDSNKNYEPSNCQWITGKENSQKTNNRKLNRYKANLIRRLYFEYKIKQKLIMWLFDISRKNIYLIINNKIWT